MKKISILILLNLSVVFGYGQNETDLPKIIPPSPEAYILRQGNKSISINTYTGALNYSVPLFTINSGDIVFPISLNYIDGNGVRVEETASRIGLGWALNITGSISRTIRDQPDDSNGNDMNDGYLFHNFSLFHIDDAYIDPSIVNNIIDDYPNNWEQLWNIYKMPLYDTEPDLYTLSSPTLSSSKFHIKYNQNRVYTHEDIYKPILNNLKITPLISQNHINGFEVIDEIGNIYLFTDEEKIQTSGEDNRYKTTSWCFNPIKHRTIL